MQKVRITSAATDQRTAPAECTLFRMALTFSALREQVCETVHLLHEYGLVVMHSGNASGIDRDSGLVLIKPSGVDITSLRPEHLAVTDLSGAKVDAARVPDGISSPL